MMSICAALFPGCFLWPLQANQIIAGTATGIWSR
jgi:hypothetical protein